MAFTISLIFLNVFLFIYQRHLYSQNTIEHIKYNTVYNTIEDNIIKKAPK